MILIPSFPVLLYREAYGVPYLIEAHAVVRDSRGKIQSIPGLEDPCLQTRLSEGEKTSFYESGRIPFMNQEIHVFGTGQCLGFGKP